MPSAECAPNCSVGCGQWRATEKRSIKGPAYTVAWEFAHLFGDLKSQDIQCEQMCDVDRPDRHAGAAEVPELHRSPWRIS